MEKPKWLHLPVFTFNSVQRKERRFRNITNLNRDSNELLSHLQAEMVELQEAIESGDRREIMCEIADIIILSSEVANAEGFSLRRAVDGKLQRNADKYPPRQLRRLQRDLGMTPQESMDFAKVRWNRSKDRSYLE